MQSGSILPTAAAIVGVIGLPESRDLVPLVGQDRGHQLRDARIVIGEQYAKRFVRVLGRYLMFSHHRLLLGQQTTGRT